MSVRRSKADIEKKYEQVHPALPKNEVAILEPIMVINLFLLIKALKIKSKFYFLKYIVIHLTLF